VRRSLFAGSKADHLSFRSAGEADTSHRHLAIGASEWEAFMEDLQATLERFAVAAGEQAGVKALIESHSRLKCRSLDGVAAPLNVAA
jgi:hypothetical protein